MEHWICNCGKKVAINLTTCPYCKNKRTKTSENTTGGASNQKLIIGALIAVIVCLGGYMIFKKDTVKVVEQPKPVYVVQQSQAPAYNPSNPNTTTQSPESLPPAVPANSNQSKKTVPQVAIDAVNALKKLQARTQVGITYKDYAPALGEVKYSINLFAESQTAKEFPELIESINSAFVDFKMAGAIWDDKFNGNKYTDDTVHKSFHTEIFTKYPDADKDSREGGVIFKYDNKEYIMIGTAVSFLFSKANQNVQKASSMIAR